MVMILIFHRELNLIISDLNLHNLSGLVFLYNIAISLAMSTIKIFINIVINGFVNCLE